MIIFFFFFFQAEDGIRDHCVTGVQTCALPISLSFPTLAACEAARQAAVEIAQEERPNPVVGLCKQTERESLVGGRTPNAEAASSETTHNTPRNTPRAVRER